MFKLLKRLAKAIYNRSEIWIDGQLYMIRYRFLPESWPGLRVHKILRSDGGRDLHDHPFTFISFILKGGYYEYRDDGSKTWYGPGSVVYRKAETLHRLELPQKFETLKLAGVDGYSFTSFVPTGEEQPAWTFVLRGPYRRTWGFQVGDNWINYQDYRNNEQFTKEGTYVK